MSRASATFENALLAGSAGQNPSNQIPDLALHVGDPGTTGASENANSGSYARQAISWNTPSGGSMTNSSSVAFQTGGTVQVTYAAGWSSATYAAGAYGIGGALTSGVTAANIAIASAAVSIAAS